MISIGKVTLVNVETSISISRIASLALACVTAACIDTVGIVLANVCVSATLVHVMAIVSGTGETALTVALVTAHIVNAVGICITGIVLRLTLVNVGTCTILHCITAEANTLERAMRVLASRIRWADAIVKTLVNVVTRASIALESGITRTCIAAVRIIAGGIFVAWRRDALVDIITGDAIAAVATLAEAYEGCFNIDAFGIFRTVVRFITAFVLINAKRLNVELLV